jgi:hypothetical protein
VRGMARKGMKKKEREREKGRWEVRIEDGN